MELHDLFADLKAYEFEINTRKEEESSTSTSTKALVTAEEPSAPPAAKTANQITSDAMALFAKRFSRFMKNNNNNSNSNNSKNTTSTNLKCFNCDRRCHFAVDYWRPKKDEKKQSDKKACGGSQNLQKEERAEGSSR